MDTNIDNLRGLTNYDYTEDTTTNRIIKVIGVGGGGGNAVTTMQREEQIQGVTFLLCNTDAQALRNSSIPDQIILGPTTTKGLGAGNQPEIARQAAEESSEDIRHKLTSDETEMVFITAGMGGGTGTGAAPIVGKISREAGKLTIGIVTIPFRFEGRAKIIQALKGVRQLQENVDSLLVVNNERLIEIYGKKPVTESFRLADTTLSNATRGISDMINITGVINLDFADVRTTLKDSGVSVISSGNGVGNNRLKMALNEALSSPLLNNNDITKSKRILMAVYSSDKDELLTEEIETLDEFTKNFEFDYESKWGYYIDNNLGEGEVKVTILASGFGYDDTEQAILGVHPTSSISEHDRAIKRAEEDKNIERYYGKDMVGSGARRRPLILTLRELDNEDLLIIAEDKPALDRDLRSVEDLRKRILRLNDSKQSNQTISTPHEPIVQDITSGDIELNNNNESIYF